MKIIKLTDEQYENLINELKSLSGYKWNDDKVHADDCYSQALIDIEINTIEGNLCN